MPNATSDPDALFAQAPCRADLAGGTYDIWPLYLFHPGAVTVNMALSILTSCKLHASTRREISLHFARYRPLGTLRFFDDLMRAKTYQHALAAYLIRFFQPKGGFTLETHSESPAGAGISGSSALMIATTAVLARFTGQALDIEQIRVIAQNVEAQLIKVPTGCQDYYPGDVRRRECHPSFTRRRALRAHFHPSRRDDATLCAFLHRRTAPVGHQQLGGLQAAH